MRPIARFLLVVFLAVAAMLAGCGGGKHPPYRTLARPPLLHLVTPACREHVMGGCLPHVPASSHGQAARPSALAGRIIGPDFSNNDPVRSSGSWRQIKLLSRFSYLKSTEGTGFTDWTAGVMAPLAKAFGLPTGGYDFLHLCGVSARDEASHFVTALRAQGLLGRLTLPPAADVEFGNGSCGGRAWLTTWIDVVVAGDGGVCPIVYTGAWFWQPNLGSFWPTCRGREVLSWISGYGVRWPFMPSGLSHLDFWQFADNGFNGATYADLSAWMHDPASFAAFAGQAAPARVICFGAHGQQSAVCARVRAQVAGWLRAEASSRRAYVARGCVLLASREGWFARHLVSEPRVRVGYRQRALGATRRTERRRGCSEFRGRVEFFGGRIRATEARYSLKVTAQKPSVVLTGAGQRQWRDWIAALIVAAGVYGVQPLFGEPFVNVVHLPREVVQACGIVLPATTGVLTVLAIGAPLKAVLTGVLTFVGTLVIGGQPVKALAPGPRAVTPVGPGGG